MIISALLKDAKDIVSSEFFFRALRILLAVFSTSLAVPAVNAFLLRQKYIFEQKTIYSEQVATDLQAMRHDLLELSRQCNSLSKPSKEFFHNKKNEILINLIDKMDLMPIIFNEKASIEFRKFLQELYNENSYCSEKLMNQKELLKRQTELLLYLKKQI